MERKPSTLKYMVVHPAKKGMTKDAADLVNHFNKEGLMLPADLGHYEELTDKGKLVVAVKPQSGVVGTVAYTQEYEKDIWEVGGMAVQDKWQDMGVGYKLLQFITEYWSHWKTLAFANENSKPLLQKFGVEEFTDFESVPEAAFDLCNSCPNKPESGCCDTIYSLAPGIVELMSADFSLRQIERGVYGIGENQYGQFAGWNEPLSEW